MGYHGSGKSTLAKQIAKEENAVIVASDEIREEIYDVNDQEHNAQVFEIANKRIKQYLTEGKNVILDATNINYKKRMGVLQKLNKLDVEKIAVMVATPYEECLKRNAKRGRVVPEEVIKRMYFNFYVPQYFEGFDEIIIEYTTNYEFKIHDLQDIAQDNPHHKLSVLEHCKKTQDLLIEEKSSIWIAGLLHDIGKLKTKTFINAKGEKTEIAHFYSHEKVSAYDSIFSIQIIGNLLANGYEKALYIIQLIQFHMLPWANLSDKSIAKYKKIFGEEFWDDLMILHKADKEAH